VPEEPPALPARPGERVRSFRPDRGFLGYLKFWFWLVAILIDVVIAVLWIVMAVALWWLALILLPVVLVIAIVPDVIAYVAVHLRFDTTWYVMTDRSLRIRRGVWVIREMTITFENVQNVKVQQGPLQRFFGVSSLVVETAGGGAAEPGKGHAPNQAVIEGIVDARTLRDQILDRLRASRSAGLGDERDARPAGGTMRRAHVGALREIRDEVRALAADS